jgi:hypothetical protein
MVQRGYKLLPGPNKEQKIYYRFIGDDFKTHVAVKTPKTKAVLIELSNSDHWLVKTLRELGEL